MQQDLLLKKLVSLKLKQNQFQKIKVETGHLLGGFKAGKQDYSAMRNYRNLMAILDAYPA